MGIPVLNLSANLMVDWSSTILEATFSLGVRGLGNLPILFRVGPRRRGTWRMRVDDAMKASYCFARALTFCLLRLNFRRSSTSRQSTPAALASSACLAFPKRQTRSLVLGGRGRTTDPLRR